jgi:hypothetical protein
MKKASEKQTWLEEPNLSQERRDDLSRNNGRLTDSEIESLRKDGKRTLTLLRGTFKDLFQKEGTPATKK